MFCECFGLGSKKWASSSLVASGVLVLALACGACAGPSTSTGLVAGWGSSGPPRAEADAGAGHARVDLEADGLEAQTPPPKRTRQEPDDPSEPFSPNYGPPAHRNAGPSETASIPADLPREFRERLVAALGTQR